MVGDADVGVSGGDFVGDGGGEEGGGRGGRRRDALAGEGDVEAVPGGDEVEVGDPGVVLAEHSVVREPEEVGDVGDVLVGRDVVGAQRVVAAPAAAVPRRGDRVRARRGGQEEQEKGE